ncbi:hypothetical protein BDK51DRAFT_41922 [Blyttiomyces helicus]|uniref:Uncharacterized protein n=1 Tax=Blyttiomyces helicus TaxID=388810 RepID=A0A4P9WMI1_9FUNG|nr:hypothetical protein BDK51DRAFT_41922 [Blyttiomyces helicus]|eukprot:RKO94279.1 hypothetical protein BDK51DRAFT_41922 [Blyttiomyces helicus]
MEFLLTPDQVKEAQKMLMKWQNFCTKDPKVPTPTTFKGIKATWYKGPCSPIYPNPYRLAKQERIAFKGIVGCMQVNGIIEPLSGHRESPMGTLPDSPELPELWKARIATRNSWLLMPLPDSGASKWRRIQGEDSLHPTLWTGPVQADAGWSCQLSCDLHAVDLWDPCETDVAVSLGALRDEIITFSQIFDKQVEDLAKVFERLQGGNVSLEGADSAVTRLRLSNLGVFSTQVDL